MKTIFTPKGFSAVFLPFLLFPSWLFGQLCSIDGDSQACANTVAVYNGAYTGSGTGPFTYQWSAFGGVASGTGTSVTVAWGSSGSGQVTLVIRDAANNVVCTSLLNVSVNPAPLPVITPSGQVGCGEKREQGTPNGRPAEECLTICDSTWVTYSTPAHAGSSYTWNITGAATVIPSVTNTIQVMWTSTGSGTVTVTETNSSGCTGSASACVKIVGRPNALFTSLNPLSAGVIQACLNQPVQFIDQSLPGSGSPLSTYQWIFGDGTSVSGTYPGMANETHSYSSSGLKEVMLIVENECHCKDTFSMMVDVSAVPGPDIFCVSTVCPGATVTYSTNASSCSGYTWSVQNGTIIGSSSSASVTVTWGSTGPGILTLEVSGCPGFCTTPTSVYVPIIVPSAQISGPAQVCIGQCYTYRISCSIPADSITWHVPPGVTVNSDTINVHEITLCYYNGSFTGGTVSADYYHHTPGSTDNLSCGGSSALAVSARPQMMLYAPAQICDQSAYSAGVSPGTTGNIAWTITDQAGSTTYHSTTLPATSSLNIANWSFGAGHFVVTANATSGQYCNSPQTLNLTVNPLPPPVDSILGADTVCPSQPYNYIALQTSSNLAVVWEVENGSPVNAVGNTISVIWDASGPYSLSAIQVDPVTGCKSDSVSYMVYPMPLTPVAPSGDTTPCANGFGSYSVNAPGEDFIWSVSPSIAGSVSAGQHSPNVTIQWNNYSGPASVTLVRTVCGQPVSSTLNVSVGMPPAPTINPVSSACEGAPVLFGTPVSASSYTWDFGDGSAGSSLQNPTHVFHSPGNHIVTLTVIYSAACPASMTVSTSIMVNPKPNVTISTPDPNVFCGPVGTVNMAVAGPVSGITYNWYRLPSTLLATNSTTYSSNVIGTYFAIGTNSFGCTDTSNFIRIDSICDTCSADPSYTLGFSRYRNGCNVDSFAGTFTPGALNPRWNFDDPFSPSNTAAGTIASHVFDEPGYYRVRFCVDVPNIYGTGYCEKCVMQVDTIEYAPGFYDSLYCVSGIDSVRVKFLNNTKWLTTLPLPSYSWNVSPGGATSTAIDPVFSLAPGIYTVTLNVAGVCSFSKTVNIPGFPDASFASTDSICVNAGMVFSNTSTGSYTGALWQFGDGASFLSTASPVTRMYDSAGTYTASLYLSNSFGCHDSALRQIVVVPNTLSVSVFPDSMSICEGDSLLLSSAPSGGYPGYTYLWNNLQTTQHIGAYYTGAYYTDVTDSKLCFAKSNVAGIMVNPVPRPEISGKEHLCLNTQYTFGVNYPAGLYTISWILDTTVVALNTSSFNLFASFPMLGSHTLIVKVSSPAGCTGFDTLQFSVHLNPVATVTSSSTLLCEGMNNVLTGSSISPGIIHTYWNTGTTGDTLVTAVAGTYTYTVNDSFGCKASSSAVVSPLPDFCGMMTGCYEICDTVSQLSWHAPPGYSAYQWYFNGNVIPGETLSVLNIPLYQAGEYTVEVTGAGGCKALSEPVNISFVSCGKCVFAAGYQIHCGPVNDLGEQTYTVALTVNNSLGSGAGYNLSSMAGTISGLTPATLTSGINTISFTFTDVSPVSNPACFNLGIYNNNTKCDTTICIKLPDCGADCEKKVELKSLDCAGFDNSGNAVYNLCVNIYWGGSTGSTLTAGTGSGSLSPSPVTLVNGMQTLCFTYTDLPPADAAATFYFYFFDPKTGKTCTDSIRKEYKPCPDTCLISIQGLCVFCNNRNDDGTITYKIGVTVFNPFGSANVSVLPTGSGTWGTITPNPIGSGMQQFYIYFTDDLPQDTTICFRVLLSSGGKTCWQDICVYLPKCDGQYLGDEELEAISRSLSVAPNPARGNFTVYYTIPDHYSDLTIELLDVAGKSVMTTRVDNRNGMQQFGDLELHAGIYFVNVRSQGQLLGFKRLVIVK